MTVASTFDPITTEIIRSALNSAANEMNTTLIRSAYTPVIYELKDCAVGLLDEQHRTLGQSAGLPIFLGNLEAVTKYTENLYGRDIWQPGDIWILNDSYISGTHLHDVTVYSPVFFDHALIGFATCRAHWLDIGAKDAGSSTDSTEIFQEGLRLGATKVVDRGVMRDDVVDLLTRNSRFPYPTRGDLIAQLACVKTGEDRLSRIVEKYGVGTVRAARDEIFAQTDRYERDAVRAITDGTYLAEGCIDSDGIDDTPRWVRVAITIEDGEMLVDLTGTDDMARGPVNCGPAQAVSAARVAYKLLVNPDNPVDGGSFSALTVKLRDGSMLSAVEPAPCEFYYTQLGLLIDLVVKALAPALPQRAAGASYGDSMVVVISGRDPRNGRPFLVYEPTVGGWGAWDGSDGEDGMINNVNGSVKDVPLEVAETKYAVYMRRYAFRIDSGGPGKWRGGNGVERQYVIEADEASLSLWFDRSVTPAWGLLDGHSGRPPEVIVNEGHPDERSQLKVNAMKLVAGDVVTTRTGGGGGYGDPRERDRALIEQDVRNRHVSIEAAREVFGLDV